MKCPNCNATLVMADRQGIEIDYCPECRGVWLDRGELDKIIERSTTFTQSPDAGPQPDPYYKDQKQYPDYKDQKAYPGQYGSHQYDPNYKHKKKKGFLSDLFDFD
jgi:Zn-finger nucleic acid-binding protein